MPVAAFGQTAGESAEPLEAHSRGTGTPLALAIHCVNIFRRSWTVGAVLATPFM
jgi:hypothetical protein